MRRESLGGAARVLALGAGILLVGAGCAPPSAGQPAGAPPDAPPARKVLIIGVAREPATIQGFAGGGSNTSRGNTETNFVHSRLLIEDADENWRPQLATEVPSVESGSWRVNADGSMDVTWRLRPGVLWHDGQLLSMDDLMFAYRVYKDRDLAHPWTAEMRLMESARSLDEHTFVVHWSRVDPRAREGRGLVPLPKHLLESIYEGDKDAFVGSRLFSDELIGLGPYRMARWERGSHMELVRFDHYFLGPPPLDGVVFRFIPDASTMIANVLAGAIDVALPPGIDLDGAAEVRRQWTGTANIVRTDPIPWFIYLEVQHRPDMMRPANGMANPSVRRALFHATNREGLAEVMTHGTAPIADSWFRPGTPLRASVEAAIPQYPYDPARAQQLLGQAGWTKGSDGLLTHSSGEQFKSELWSNTRVIARGEKQLALVAQDWKAVGAEMGIYTIPAARSNDRRHEAESPIASLTTTPVTGLFARLNSANSAGPANDWSGRNKMVYTSPSLDTLLNRFAVSIESSEQVALQREIVREVLGEVVLIPLYWEMQPVLMLSSVAADIHANNSAWNAASWSKR